jgi:hypothetical protein
MPFPDDLLDQARFLVHRDPKRPKQANLRRAVSTAYYAVFHLLSAEAAAQASPARPAGLNLREQRTLSHGDMKTAAQGFLSLVLPKQISPLIQGSVSRPLISVADAFVRLQEERHIADYDLAIKFDRAQAQDAVARATRLFRDWNAIRNSEEAHVFLAALVFGRQWKR